MEDAFWKFAGYESPSEGRPVQVWFDSLPDSHRHEILETIQYLRSIPTCWDEIEEPLNEFDALLGENGISEIRIPVIRSHENEITKNFRYRIYGALGPDEDTYTFLHAWAKSRANDKDGKRIASQRLERLRNFEADVHEFDFAKLSSKETDERV